MSAASITVAHVVTCLQVGGLERVVVNLVRGFQGLPYRQLVVCLEEGGAFVGEVEKLGATVIVLGKQPGLSWRTIRQLAKLFRQEKVGIVHSHNPSPHFHGVLAAVLAGVQARVHTKHGRNYPGIRKRVLLNRALAWLTDVIVPVSDNAGAVALQIEKVNPNKVRRIWNGVDTEQYRPVVSRQQSAARRLVIGTVARLSPEKDQLTMLAAFKLVLEQWVTEVGSVQQSAASGQSSQFDVQDSKLKIQQTPIPDFQSSSAISDPSSLIPLGSPRLVIIGDGPCLAELQTAAQRLGIASHVDFLGARSDIPNQLLTFDIFTLSSVTEGISMTILEAMACEVPIVASDVGGNREIVQPPECGLIVPARDPQALATAYLELLRDRIRRMAMGVAGRKRVIEHFSLQAMVRSYAELYFELLKRKAA